jgi:hypothetical protein
MIKNEPKRKYTTLQTLQNIRTVFVVGKLKTTISFPLLKRAVNRNIVTKMCTIEKLIQKSYCRLLGYKVLACHTFVRKLKLKIFFSLC